MPRISVIIPTHNRADVVGEALASVLAQDYRDFEVVVVDDGSTDDTAAVVQTFGEPVRLVRRPCGGPAAARNTGIRESRGEFVCFLDSDDLYLPQRLAGVASFLDRHPEYDAAYSDWAILHEDGRLTRRPGHGFPSGRVFEPLVLRQLWHTNTITLRRRCFDQVGLFDESLPRWEDRDFWLRLAWSCRITAWSGVPSPAAEREPWTATGRWPLPRSGWPAAGPSPAGSAARCGRRSSSPTGNTRANSPAPAFPQMPAARLRRPRGSLGRTAAGYWPRSRWPAPGRPSWPSRSWP